MALVVIADLIIRAGDLTAHYTNEGVWPTELLHDFGWNKGYWSLHALDGTYNLELSLFVLHFIFAFCLLVGFKTQLFTLLTWLFTISLHNRNLFILQGGDDLLRLILLWGIFLPWQAHYSVDSKLKPQKTKQNISANLGYLLLLTSVYFFSANLKSSPQWHSEGSAVYYALSLEQLRLPLGEWLYGFPVLLKLFTWFVLYGEYLIAVLLLLPSKKGTYRFIAFILLFLIHLGIGLTLYVGLFFVIGIISAIGILPTFMMNKLENIFNRSAKKTLEYSESPTPSFLLKWINKVLCALLIFLCILVNLSTVSWFPYEMRDELAYTSNTLRLNQYWGMFSPSVMQKDGWFVYHGMDSIGRQWDLRRNEDYVDYAKPKRIVNMYKNDRWRKLAENMQKDSYTFLRPLYCKYRIHRWNKRHPEKKISSLSIYFMEKENLADYKTTTPVKILHCVCYDD